MNFKKQKVVSRDKKNDTGRYEKIEDDMDNLSVTKSVNKETIAKPLEQPVDSSHKPKLKKQVTLLELSGQCENLEDVPRKYEASSRVHLGEVFVFGHRQSSVIEDIF